MIEQIKKDFGFKILLVIVVAGFFGLGFWFGEYRSSSIYFPAGISGTVSSTTEEADFAPFWKAWKILDQQSVFATSTSAQDKVWGAISGLASSYGDPYTTFFPPVEAKDFASQISGNFEGVGMELGVKDKVLIVIAPLKDTPAYKAGIKPGDKILKINDTLTGDMSVEKAVSIIRGKKGTSVKFTISRTGEKDLLTISVVRDTIQIPTIDTQLLKDSNIFIIRLYNFSANSPDFFRNALRDFIMSGSHKLILDLRGNPGGYLEAATDMASWFLPADKIIVKEVGVNGVENDFRSKGYNIFTDKLRMVILVNSGTASAAEILSGALEQYGIAELVGETTFGKGSVQQLFELTPNTSLKVTIAKWLTPNGTWISKAGLKPDVEVTLSDKDLASGKDSQQLKAVEILSKME